MAFTHSQLTRLRLNAAFGKKLNPLAETREIINDILAEYKTPASKKAFMTREMKQHVEYMKEVVTTVTEGSGWYLGDYYTTAHILHYANELVLLQEIKQSLG